MPPSSPLRRPRLSRRRASGYTAVEVLMAMTVMMIGAAAVMSMQKTSVQGNLDARKTDVANAVGRTWMERLQRDAMQWTCPGPSCPSTTNMGTSSLIVTSANVTGLWFLPKQYLGSTSPETMSPGFDILGRDLPQAQLAPTIATGWPGASFCVNVRLQWLVPQSLPTEPGLLRADVRVLWPRGITGGAPKGGYCDDNTAALSDPETIAPAGEKPFFHALYFTTIIKETPAQ
ncbi:MAG TPA: prepilin-type N-terminal cleavage/methylation domain-containing protein [Polyangiaceae bacterium]